MTEIHTPDWVKHAVFYQIFPDRFAISAQVEKPTNLEPWASTPTQQGYKGGDLLGVVEHLSHIQDLGVTAIYFTPIFQSACNHRYHTHDYYQVDPLLGGNSALRSLIDACHERGIKVVLDGVFNHASRGFFQFNDILENGPHSPWIDWFTIEGWPLSPYDGSHPANYVSWVDNRALPKFNTDNPQVREFIMRIAEYWLRFGIDGWRLDVPFEITTPGFWQEFRQRVKAINPEAYIVGEVWRDAGQWLQGDQFDGVMNYLFAGATIAFTAGSRVLPELIEGRDYAAIPALSAMSYAATIDWIQRLYPHEIQLAQLNLLASHDTARLLSIAQGDRASVELATLLLLTFPGAPSIYYGDEIGLEGRIDPDSRRSFPWDQTEQWDFATLAFHKQLIAIRHAHPALRIGSFHRLYADLDVYAFVRIHDDQRLLVVVNTADAPRTVIAPISNLFTLKRPLISVYGPALAQIDSMGLLQIDIPPRAGAIFIEGAERSDANGT
jgi:cyclomaltodextrinase / maltogenic alpha-amylase / neopullulanase